MISRSLVNIVLDLLELDAEAPENKAFIETKFNELEVKVDNYIQFDQFIDSQVEMINKEIEHLNSERKKYDRLALMLRHKAGQAMMLMETKQLKSDTGHKISIRESKSVEIIDASKIPDELMRIIPETKEPDKKAIKKVIESGNDVTGAQIIIKEYVQFS